MTMKVATSLCVLFFSANMALGTTCCPLCLAPTQTWSEIVRQADIVVLAELESRIEPDERTAPSGTFIVRQVYKGHTELGERRRITIDDYIYGKIGDSFLLAASPADPSTPAYLETFAVRTRRPNASAGAAVIRKVSATSAATPGQQWDAPTIVTPEEFRYITSAPEQDSEQQGRLRFFLGFLEHDRNLIAADAWGEFARSEYSEIRALSGEFPREKLREWIADPEASPERLSLYGLMLGMCGDESDADFLRAQIGMDAPAEVRFGIEGLMGGLLALSGESGLEFLEHTRLQSDVETLEAFAAVQAIQFIWNHEPDRIPKKRLQQALHLTLDDESLREISIRNLARWKDWTLVPRLTEVYDVCKNDDPGTTRAIVGYLTVRLRATDAPDGSDRQMAEALLEAIRKDDPRLVSSVEWELRRPTARRSESE